MTSFLHDLIDPGANWCPVCGEPRGVCQCDESDFMPEAADDWGDDDDLEEIGEDWLESFILKSGKNWWKS